MGLLHVNADFVRRHTDSSLHMIAASNHLGYCHGPVAACIAGSSPRTRRTDNSVCSLQLIAVFDADMVCSKEFFMKTLPRIVDDRVSLVLTPQAYHNYDPATDIFNHSAFAYWSMMVPGEDAWGHIVCTGRLILAPLPPLSLPSPSPPPLATLSALVSACCSIACSMQSSLSA